MLRPLLVLCLLAAGCSPPEYRYRVAVVPKGMTHAFWQSIHAGALRAAADLEREFGFRTQVVWDGPMREREALAQIRILDRRISTNIDAIVLAPTHSRTLVAAVERAVDQGIPVVVIDSGLERPELAINYIATDNFRGGVLAGERLLQVLKEAGKTEPRIVLFRYAVGSESTEKREAGFEKAIEDENARRKAAGEPLVVWLSKDKYAGSTKDSALKEAGPLVSQHGDKIDGIFAPNESSADGMLDALRSHGLSGKVKLVGFDSSEPLLQAVDEGEVHGLILQDPYRMGYLGVWTAVQHLRGYALDVPSHDVSTGENVVTKENLHDVATRELFDRALQEKRTIVTPPVKRRP